MILYEILQKGLIKMMYSVCNFGKMSARLEIIANATARKIFVEIRAYGMGEAVNKVYPADKYGEALDEYHAICEEMQRRFNSEKAA